MGTKPSRRALLTWDDIDSEGKNLEPTLQELLSEIITAQRAQATNNQTSDGPWYIAKVNIQGHVGIGQTPLPLDLTPANGITIISGRNGTGKTSAADAIRHVLSAGQQRSYQLAEQNLHYANKSIVVTLTNGEDNVEVSCGADGLVKWSKAGSPADGVPTAWADAFARYLPVLLYPEISPIIENPAGLHEFLKDALELTTLTMLMAAVDDIRKDGREAARTVQRAYETARRSAIDRGHLDVERQLDELGQTPGEQDLARLRTLVTAIPARTASRVELAETWPHEGAEAERTVQAVARLLAARSDVVDGAKTVHQALTLLQRDEAYLADFRRDDVCPVCRTPGAHWADQAGSHSGSLTTALAELREAEHAVRAEIERIRPFLPPALPPRTREALRKSADPAVADRLDAWDRLASKAADLTEDTVATLDIASTLAAAAELAGWYENAKTVIAQAAAADAADQADVRTRVTDWVKALRAERDHIRRGKLADKLGTRVTAWIKQTRTALFNPISDRIVELWSILNSDADLELTDVAMGGGARQAGKVALKLVAQGVPVTKEAGGELILSTGQRNALSLATYFPRATQPTSPFRFLVLDDPVHAFDDWRVRFLAGQLAELGKHHQIIVFTHDNRLCHELRALGCDPTHIRLDRPPGEKSYVRVTDITRPSGHLLEELRKTLAQEGCEELGTPGARAAMALAMCRQALDTEITTQLEVLGRRLGKPDDDFQSDLRRAHMTREKLGLLNRYARGLSLAPVRITPYEDLLTNLNAGAHGRAHPAARQECQNWAKQTRQLADAIYALTGQL